MMDISLIKISLGLLLVLVLGPVRKVQGEPFDVTVSSRPVNLAPKHEIDEPDQSGAMQGYDFTTRPIKHFSNTKYGYRYDYYAGSEKLISVKVVPIDNVRLYFRGKDEGPVTYLPKKNAWYSQDTKEDICIAPTAVGPQSISAYGQPGNHHADECSTGIVILTNRGYALDIDGRCGNKDAFDKVLQTFQLRNEQIAVTARCAAGWNHVEAWNPKNSLY